MVRLKTIKAIHLLHDNASSQPTQLEDETYLLKQDMMDAFLHPSRIETRQDWINWIFFLNSDPDHRYALEFEEGWNGMRVVFLGLAILVAVVLSSLAWAGW